MGDIIEQYGDTILSIISCVAIVAIFAGVIFLDDGSVKRLILEYIKNTIG